jgi:pantoate--beta-alanine ligase
MIRQLVTDLNFGVAIVGVPTVREGDGLAMSSRNRYLDAAQRELASTLSAALLAGAHAAGAGERAALNAAQAVLDAVPEIGVDYLELRDADLGPAQIGRPGRLLVAARLGSTRLLDNIAIDVEATPAPLGPDTHESPWRN